MVLEKRFRKEWFILDGLKAKIQKIMVCSRWIQSKDLEKNSLLQMVSEPKLEKNSFLQMVSEQRFRKEWFALDGYRVKIQKRMVCSKWFQLKVLEQNTLLQMVSDQRFRIE